MDSIIINNSNLPEYSKGKNYSGKDSSFSPYYSTIGLNLTPDSDGIKEFWFNYNRACRTIWEHFAKFKGRFIPESSSIVKTVFCDDTNSSFISFYDTDCFTFELNGESEIDLFCEPSNHLGKFWCDDAVNTNYLFKGFSLNDIDARDPDANVPFAVSVNIIEGIPSECNGRLTIKSKNGRILFNFAFAALNINTSDLIYKSQKCSGIEKAEKESINWVKECLGNCKFSASSQSEAITISKAILGLIQNLSKAQGNLENHISSFPSRGTYPTHFLWDSCFQNLAYELMNPQTAKDAILCLLDNIRSDGKIGQFICSTWIRPHFSQPPLVGWAALRYVKSFGDIDFAEHILPALEKNNQWWLTSRITPCGLISCPDGLETGQDDSPRFDNGTTISVDMNSYLLSQMRATSELYRITGNYAKAEQWSKKSDDFSDLIIKYLYDEKQNIFNDITPDTLEPVNVLCCSNLLPLWAGVNLHEKKIRGMINDYLLNPKYFFGNIPFPSVSYSDKTYKPEAWWRGPTWLPIAYLMLETLRKYGYSDEFDTAAKKLYNMILNDGNLREVYNSQTGEGMCAYEQGWSCAIFLKLNKILYGQC